MHASLEQHISYLSMIVFN